MESKIKWQQGCPEQSGNYIVTMSTGEVTLREFYNPYTSHSYWEGVEEDNNVIAWCSMSDIEPYKPDYPKTYGECCEVLGKTKAYQSVSGYKTELLEDFQELLICRDAYWEIADWEFNYDEKCYYLCPELGEIQKYEGVCDCNAVLAFPTKELRDMFLENFRELINQCKELL